MFAWMRYSEGLIVAHAFLIVSFLIGASFLPPRDDRASESSASQKMVRMVCTCGLGFAVLGFGALFLALIGLLNVPAISVLIVALFAAGSLFWKESPFRSGYWKDRIDTVGASWDAPALFVYYLMLAAAFPAVNLVNVGTDPLTYHLAYAADWVSSGRLVVDPFLDPPFYASNFSLLYSILLLLHAQVFVIFLVWITCLLTALGIFAGLRWLIAEQKIRSTWATLAALFLTLAGIFPPSFYVWAVTAYVDVPIGAFALLATLAIILAVREKQVKWLVVAAVLAGFLIGMKASFIAFIPVFAIALIWAARGLQITRQAVLGLFALLLVASSPWYVRNFIEAGDPIAPTLNLALHGTDGLYTPFEVAELSGALHGSRSPKALATLPLRAFRDAEGPSFVAEGVTALVMMLYLPALILLVAMQWPKVVQRETAIAVFILCMLVGYWAMTSTSMRYASVFFPLLALCVGMTICLPLRSLRWRGPAIALFAALLMIPTPGTAAYYRHYIDVDFTGLPSSYLSDHEYQALRIDGYDEAEFTAAMMHRSEGPGLVYILASRGESLHYIFRLEGVRSAGGWFGPAGWTRLYDAIDAGLSAQFLDGLGVRAVLVAPWAPAGGLELPLRRQLLAHGYCEVKIPQSTYQLYLHCADVRRSLVRRAERQFDEQRSAIRVLAGTVNR